MKILIVGINFSPEETGCAPYTSDLAFALCKLGHEVEVVAGLPHYPDWRVPEKYKRRTRFEDFDSGVKINRLWHYVPRVSGFLNRVIYEISFAIHARIFTQKFRPQIVVVVSPSLLSIASVLHLKKKGAKLRVLVQDIFSSAVQELAPFRSLLGGHAVHVLENTLMKSADSIAVVNKIFAEKLHQFGVRLDKVFCLPNYILPELAVDSSLGNRKAWDWRGDQRIVLYTGNLGTKQDLGNLIEAAKLLERRAPEILISIYGSGNQKRYLKQKILSIKNVEIKDLVPKADYMNLLRSADLLLVHESPDLKSMSISSKLTSYRASRRPILVVCSKNSPTYEDAKLYNLAICAAGDPQRLADDLVLRLSTPIPPMAQSIDFDLESDAREKRINWSLHGHP